jgi:hypothetical protein
MSTFNINEWSSGAAAIASDRNGRLPEEEPSENNALEENISHRIKTKAGDNLQSQRFIFS